ncbi:hypothetical protein PIIN_03920 [Serendipita indica DSM 11827]|uniref:Uncharacterized protein n=1 Tax=Serendipita indica (strain DSM 11827) TaxID=1109443 RepID=G4TF87_SERID|nr:hypothetical protein PIIN_03920 [Serendipita indica DSM 11827]
MIEFGCFGAGVDDVLDGGGGCVLDDAEWEGGGCPCRALITPTLDDDEAPIVDGGGGKKGTPGSGTLLRPLPCVPGPELWDPLPGCGPFAELEWTPLLAFAECGPEV